MKLLQKVQGISLREKQLLLLYLSRSLNWRKLEHVSRIFHTASSKKTQSFHSVSMQRSRQNLVAKTLTHGLCNVDIYWFGTLVWFLYLLGITDETISQDTHSAHSGLFQNQPECSWSFFPSHWASLLPEVANHLLRNKAVSYQSLLSSFPYARQVALRVLEQSSLLLQHTPAGNNNSTSGIQLLSQMTLHCITTKPQGCSKHPLSANSIPLPEIRKQEHTQPSLLSASSSSPAPLCWGLSTSVLQYSSHWLNCTCLPIS